ncbi:MAG: NTPase [Candidatus Aminicenantes bacterium]|nr:MAG: NTPase [Candidatus Aminicenantes bacterium]
MNNYLITGPPRCGKTTLILKVTQNPLFSSRCGGFITEEVREKGERIGFKIISLPDKKEGFLAKKRFSSPHRVGKYGVNLKDLEDIGCSAIEDALDSNKTVVVDEIGKMELFSEKFKNSLLKALDSPQKVLASIMERRNEFADRVKNRTDVTLVFLNRANFESVLEKVSEWITGP